MLMIIMGSGLVIAWAVIVAGRIIIARPAIPGIVFVLVTPLLRGDRTGNGSERQSHEGGSRGTASATIVPVPVT